MGTAEVLAPYVPAFLADWCAAAPRVRHRRVDGTLAFVDVSGFTRLTERLSTRGKVGAEELTGLLDGTFEVLLAVAHEHGAWLVKWGGDAVLLLFEGEDHAARACTAAHAMRGALAVAGRLRTSVGPVRLRVSTGVHTGEVDFLLTGASSTELVVTGPAATQTVAMEAAAAAGEVAVSPATAARLRPGLTTAAGDGARLLVRSPGVPRTEPSSHAGPGAAAADVLSGCLPPPVREHLLAGPVEPDHRVVAVAFVEFAGTGALLAHHPAQAVDAVDALVRACQEAADREGVTFWETDVGRDGGKIMLVAGAPQSTGADADAVLAVARAALDAGLEGARPLQVRVGVNGGRVFFGGFGPPSRRTLSVKGDAVNLAARLMGRAAPGQLLASAAVLERTRSTWPSAQLPAFLVKGRRQPVLAATIERRQEAARVPAGRGLPLVGREEVLDALLTEAAQARSGRLRVVEVTGEAGAGTTRLLTELAARVPDRVLLRSAERDGSSAADGVARRLLRPLLGPAAADAAALQAALADVAPGLVPWAPLVGEVLDVGLPDTPATAALDGRFRTTRRAEVVAELLCALLPGPVVLVVDDAQQLDAAGAELLATLVARAEDAPWLLLLGRRAEATGGAPTDPVRAVGAPGRDVALGPLADGDALALLRLLTEQRPLPPHDEAELVRRAGGNPLFLQSLAEAVGAGGGVADLPDTVEGVVAAAVHRLPPGDRRLLRAAAVLGVEVDLDVLEAVAARTGEPLRDDALARLNAFLTPAGPGRLRFPRALVRETAYEGLAYTTRRALHGHAADVLLARRGDDAADLLSLHLALAQRHEEAARYALIAGRRAQAVSAPASAAAHYARAVDSLQRAGAPGAHVREAAEVLGDVRYRLGEFRAAAQAYRAASRLTVQPLPRARLHHKAALALDRQGAYRRALGELTVAERLLGSAPPDPSCAELLAQVLTARGVVRHWQGRTQDAVGWCRRAVALAETLDAPAVLADALVWLDALLAAAGEPSDGEEAVRALALWLELGDRPWHEGRTLNVLGARAYYAGRWDDALELYAQSQAACARAGDAFTAAVEAANRAEILSDQGRLALAEPLLRDALRVCRAAGAPSFVAFVRSTLGRLLARDGRAEEGAALLEQARAAYVEDGEQAEVLETDVRLAECRLLAGRPGEALDAADRILGAGSSTRRGELPQLATLLRLRGLALAALGDVAAGCAALEESVAVARTRAADADLVLGLWALSDVGGATAPELEAERERLAVRLALTAAAGPTAALTRASGRRPRPAG